MEEQEPRIYEAKWLHLENIPGVVRVGTARTTGMSVQVSGPQKLVERVAREVQGETLYVRGPAGGGGVNIVQSGGGRVVSMSSGVVTGHVVGMQVGSMHMGSGGIWIDGTDDVVVVNGRVVSGGGEAGAGERGEVEVNIEVPRTTPIRIEERGVGRYEIGSTEGPMDARLKGSGGVSAGRLGETRVTLSGQGDVTIGAVEGPALHVRVNGQGDLVVRDGNVEELNLHLSGMGNMQYGGTAKRADLKVSGMGNIRVNEVTEHLDDRASGMGRIQVHVPPKRDRNSFWS